MSSEYDEWKRFIGRINKDCENFEESHAVLLEEVINMDVDNSLKVIERLFFSQTPETETQQ